ncbi:MAG: sigma-70 family RNA polymerase sigma factor [Caldilinea sp.]
MTLTMNMPVTRLHTQQDEPSTTSLVRRCIQGDADAWSHLIERYARLVHAVPVRHGLTPHEVEDVGQEVFLALAQSLHEIEDPERLPGWLMTTARRTTWRMIQRRRYEESLDIQDDSVEDSHTKTLVAANPTPDELLDGWNRQAVLAQGLERLQLRCRQLLILLFLDKGEPSYDDISEQLGIPKGSIGPTRNRCLQQLRSILQGLCVSDSG